ncbi:hypothetical protein DFP72DRAFT_869348 [Ephemerocybe angulata]|uniref:COX assembly mitochondrial protein n=2 Tax=Ephemerocybe angulata TaxID=980116 RepID=A0A8H6IFY4_9AGAR|nr:hypothetical protein DFP72DRAFT_869348 [Tulosesus angulatus]
MPRSAARQESRPRFFRSALCFGLTMHAQLSDKKLVCKEFIEALERCHASGWNRLTGMCNNDKDALNTCLRAERKDRTAKNNEKAKERRSKAELALKEFNS